MNYDIIVQYNIGPTTTTYQSGLVNMYDNIISIHLCAELKVASEDGHNTTNLPSHAIFL